MGAFGEFVISSGVLANNGSDNTGFLRTSQHTEKRMSKYTDTTGSLARQAGVAPPTVRKYADEALLDFVTASNGTRLFREGQAGRVQEIYRERIARRGHKAA
jgi:hypothetical protein